MGIDEKIYTLFSESKNIISILSYKNLKVFVYFAVVVGAAVATWAMTRGNTDIQKKTFGNPHLLNYCQQ